MATTLKVLLIGLSDHDTLLILDEIRQGGYEPVYARIDTPEYMAEALEQRRWEIVIANCVMPRFSAQDAVQIIKQKGLDLPLITVTGKTGEDAAVEAMEAGVDDYIINNNLARLVPAISHEIHNAAVRREYKRSKKSLKLSKSKYRLLYNTMIYGVLSLDITGKIISANPLAEKILGLPLEQILGRSITDPRWQIINEDGSDFTKERHPAMVALRTKRSVRHVVMGIFTQQGKQLRWLSVNAVPWFEPGTDKPSRWYVIFEDITERKKTMEFLWESEKRFRLFFENAPVCYQSLDQDRRILEVNSAWLAFFGYYIEEVTGRFFCEFMMPKFKNQYKKLFARYKAAGEVSGLVLKVFRKDGSPAVISISGRITYDKQGNFKQSHFVFFDLTERKRAENLLKRYHILSENARDIILFAHLDGRIIEANKAAVTAYGYAREDLQALNIRDLCKSTPLALLQEQINQARKKGILFETVHYRKDGTFFPVEVSSQGAVIDGKMILLNVIRDITQRKKNEYRLKQTEQKLLQSLGRISETIHEIVDTLSKTVEIRDPYTAGHQYRVAKLACAIAEVMGLPQEQIEGIYMTGMLHDLGKIYIPAEILSKPGKISSNEYQLIKTHPKVGYDILKKIDFEFPVAEVVLQHHERMDGSGYPAGLTDEKILMQAKILAVADVVEAMASHRPYRPSLGLETALKEITTNRGKLYSPEVVDTCIELFEQGYQFD